VDGWIARAGGSGVDRRERGAGGGHEARERLLHCGGRGGLVRRGRLPACPKVLVVAGGSQTGGHIMCNQSYGAIIVQSN